MPNYEGSRHEARGDRVRNRDRHHDSPTGTISMIAGCSGGIEPTLRRGLHAPASRHGDARCQPPSSSSSPESEASTRKS